MYIKVASTEVNLSSYKKKTNSKFNKVVYYAKLAVGSLQASISSTTIHKVESKQNSYIKDKHWKTPSKNIYCCRAG